MTSELTLQPQHSQWLKTPGLQRLFDLLDDNGDVEQTRVIGGAVRNSVLGEKIGDVDLSTTLNPEQVMERLKKANIKTIATGLSHGTVTAVVDHLSYEITTLRSDQLSGGGFISNWTDKQPGEATYSFQASAGGNHVFWVRANPAATKLSYRLDGGQWQPIDMKSSQENINIAEDPANESLVLEMAGLLQRGWRAALPPSP